MNPRLKTTLLVLAVLLPLALLVLGFFQGFEQETREVHTGYGEKALKNNYLAAGWLLERLGLKVTFIKNALALQHLPEKEGTLFIPGSSRGFSDKRIDDLLDWMAAGGSLVATADVLLEENLSVQDRLLEHFGIKSRVLENYMLKEKSELAGSRPLRLYNEQKVESAAEPAVKPAVKSAVKSAADSETRAIVYMGHAVVLLDSEDRAF